MILLIIYFTNHTFTWVKMDDNLVHFLLKLKHTHIFFDTIFIFQNLSNTQQTHYI